MPFAERVVEVHVFPHRSFEADVVVVPGAIVRGVVVDDDFHQVDGAGLCARVDAGSGPVYAAVSAQGTFVATGVTAAPMAAVTIVQGCDYTAGFIPRAGTSVGQIRAGDDIGVIAVVPHGPWSTTVSIRP
jgi:hypothetical protein